MQRKRQPLPTIANCDNCGACCTEQAALPMSWYVPAITLWPRSIPAELIAELEALRNRFLLEGFPPDGSACIWYDAESRRCLHYEYRPEICRTEVEIGDESCRLWRTIVGVDPQ